MVGNSRSAPKAIITVMRQGDERAWDVEVPADVQAIRLVQMIVQAMGWEAATSGRAVSFVAKIQPSGRTLKPQECLADMGVWDGASLVLMPAPEPR